MLSSTHYDNTVRGIDVFAMAHLGTVSSLTLFGPMGEKKNMCVSRYTKF